MLFRDSRKIARGRSFSEERCCPCGCACQRCEKEFASRPESHPYTSSKSQKTRRYCLNVLSSLFVQSLLSCLFHNDAQKSFLARAQKKFARLAEIDVLPRIFGEYAVDFHAFLLNEAIC